MAHVTLLEIARRLGISKTAVSLALRGKPGLSAETQQRVLDLASVLGYVPNPVSAELMALVRAKRHVTGTQTIAFLNTLEDPHQMRSIPGFWEFISGAQARAVKYGYEIDVLELHAVGMNVMRLASIMEARGIRGVLVGPSWATQPLTGFPWHQFSAVMMGDPERGDHVYRVCHHHLHGCMTALQNLAAKGYRNIGVALNARNQRNTGYAYTLAVERFIRENGATVRATSWLYDQWDGIEGIAWVGRHGFDAVVGVDFHVAEVFSLQHTESGDRLGFASLHHILGAPWSGINQHTEAIGAAAVDLLRGLLLGGERGVAARPQIVLVDGEWVEGDTTPGPVVAIADSFPNVPPRS